MAARHEVGHVSDHTPFGGAAGDHASSGLMHPTANQNNTFPFGDGNFNDSSILHLRGWVF